LITKSNFCLNQGRSRCW